jgi:RecA-family ATPase
MTSALAPATPASRFLEGLVAASRLGESGAPMREVALALANAGWPVFPCGLDKAPLVGGGFKARSLDLEQLNRWWLTHPHALPAIVPGDGDLAALDVDSAAAAATVDGAGYLDEDGGFVVETGGTSKPFTYGDRLLRPIHVYVRATEQPKLRGVVARFESGYVIAPGARRAERVYRVASSNEPEAWTGDTEATPAAETIPAEQRSEEAPDVERVRQAVACVPNDEKMDRERYVGMAHMIRGALGEEGRDIFLEWAGRWTGGDVNPDEDERVWDTLPPSQVGWYELWHVAAGHGFDASPEIQADAQSDFTAEGDPPPSLAQRLRVSNFGDIADKAVEWLLAGRLARQQITMLNGWPGEGKTSVAIDLVARLSRGQPLIDGTAPPRALRVLVCSTEDSQTVLKNRLRAAGADLERVLTVPDTMLDHLKLPSKQQNWIDLVHDLQIDVIVVDPMMSFVDDNLKSISEQDARKFALALRQVCEETQAAALCIRHPNKATAGGHMNPVSASSGSLAFTAAARIEMLVGRLPDSDDERAMAHVKNNLSAPPVALVYQIKSAALEFESGSDSVAAVEWLRRDETITADDLLARRESREVRTQLAEAKEFLEQRLADGPDASASVMADAKQQGIAERTLRRAREQVGWSEYVGSPRYGGITVWGLKQHTMKDYKPKPTTLKDSEPKPQKSQARSKARAAALVLSDPKAV